MVTKRFRNPWTLSSALASLRTLQPWALGFLNHLVTLVSASNLYLAVRGYFDPVGYESIVHYNITAKLYRIMYLICTYVAIIN